MTKLGVIFYSMYGHNFTMAKAAVEGAKKVAGVEVSLYKIGETLPKEVLEKMHAVDPAKQWADVPTITPAIIKDLDACIFGFPTRFGNMSAQVKTFFDSCGQIWAANALVGKVASVFTSSNTQHGGQESTILSTFPVLMHLGFIYVGLPYSCAAQFDMSELHGGSPYGASTMAGGDGSRQPTDMDKAMAAYQGEHVAKIAHSLTSGRTHLGLANF